MKGLPNVSRRQERKVRAAARMLGEDMAYAFDALGRPGLMRYAQRLHAADGQCVNACFGRAPPYSNGA